MVGAISHNRNRLLPCVCILDGEYGEKDIAMGVPCVLNEQGMSRIIDLELTDEEMAMFHEFAGAVRADIGLLCDPEGSGRVQGIPQCALKNGYAALQQFQ